MQQWPESLRERNFSSSSAELAVKVQQILYRQRHLLPITSQFDEGTYLPKQIVKKKALREAREERFLNIFELLFDIVLLHWEIDMASYKSLWKALWAFATGELFQVDWEEECWRVLIRRNWILFYQKTVRGVLFFKLFQNSWEEASLLFQTACLRTWKTIGPATN